MQAVDLSTLVAYHGADISSSVINPVAEEFTSENVSFSVLDICSDPLPKADLMMCRDCLFHLKHEAKWAFFRNFIEADIPYLLTSIDHVRHNQDLKKNGGYQRFNPMIEPFNFPMPLYLIHETSDAPEFDLHDPNLGNRQHRSMGIWSRDTLVQAVGRRPSNA
ncbi:class I SAM-dependent methyltransferase [uncultured Ruegeria sp.]|uniref:class I SAM-dependent methyltransferase n=1 Tax=uncultured Ruegeria sp. TaxID=259304 RepID=UPI0026378D2C|nr:class I SAM-dependent methyltransferase [uncultured Ruegeria sp.]